VSVLRAAVSIVERDDGLLLCVWNRRYSGWSLPGGLVEDGETVEQAQARELREETSLETVARELVYDGPTGLAHAASRAGHVTIFRVLVKGEPRESEPGCPIRWLARAEFLASSPFAPLYRRVFAKLPERRRRR
jgi:8-oxo-dGTP diphosphatase